MRARQLCARRARSHQRRRRTSPTTVALIWSHNDTPSNKEVTHDDVDREPPPDRPKRPSSPIHAKYMMSISGYFGCQALSCTAVLLFRPRTACVSKHGTRRVDAKAPWGLRYMRGIYDYQKKRKKKKKREEQAYIIWESSEPLGFRYTVNGSTATTHMCVLANGDAKLRDEQMTTKISEHGGRERGRKKDSVKS